MIDTEKCEHHWEKIDEESEVVYDTVIYMTIRYECVVCNSIGHKYLQGDNDIEIQHYV